MSKFITFEGGEGSGKTTQSKLLARHLQSQNIKSIWTREIGGTNLAEKIRDVVIHNDMDPMTELLLVMAARKEHLDKIILPALKNGLVVICDRFIDSSLCYQGSHIGNKKVLDLHRNVFGDDESLGAMPDITFFIDVEVEEGLRRANIRGANNKFEAKELAEHMAIREGFLELSKIYPNRIIRIDGMRSEEAVHEEIVDKLSCVRGLFP